MRQSDLYTYVEFMTGKIKRTRGTFVGWTEPTGPLNVRYAQFENPKSTLLVPAYCLTQETRQAIEKLESETA